jgi:CrcB protein
MGPGMPASLLVFLGGGLGALSRWLLSTSIESLALKTSLHRFPFGVLACNLLGCLAGGLWCGAWAGRQAPGWVFPLMVTGFLGGFTTFSAFGNDTRQLLAEGFGTVALTNVLVSTVGGIALVIIGFRLAHS